MERVKQKHFMYYWTTSNDANYTELQKVEGSICVNANGLILGIVNDRNNLHPKNHVICGMQVDSHMILLDLRSFDFLNPVSLDFFINSSYGESIANTSTIAYTKVPSTPSKVVLQNTQLGDLKREEIISQCQEWMRQSTPKSVFHFHKFFQIFSKCVNVCSQELSMECREEIVQAYFHKIRLLSSEEAIAKENIFPFPFYGFTDSQVQKREKKIG